MATHTLPTEDQIRERARQYYEDAGAPQGRDEEFWLRAERDLSESPGPGNATRGQSSASSEAPAMAREKIR